MIELVRNFASQCKKCEILSLCNYGYGFYWNILKLSRRDVIFLYQNENKNIFNQDIKSDEGNLDSIFDDITAPPSNSTTEIFQFKEEYPSYRDGIKDNLGPECIPWSL